MFPRDSGESSICQGYRCHLVANHPWFPREGHPQVHWVDLEQLQFLHVFEFEWTWSSYSWDIMGCFQELLPKIESILYWAKWNILVALSYYSRHEQSWELIVQRCPKSVYSWICLESQKKMSNGQVCSCWLTEILPSHWWFKVSWKLSWWSFSMPFQSFPSCIISPCDIMCKCRIRRFYSFSRCNLLKLVARQFFLLLNICCRNLLRYERGGV